MRRPGARIDWRGRQVQQHVVAASAAGINDVLARSVGEAKGSHPGWRNRSGNAEGSIRVIDVATGASLVGRWGSVGVVYMRRLEFEHGAALRSAADVTYPTLSAAIRRRL